MSEFEVPLVKQDLADFEKTYDWLKDAHHADTSTLEGRASGLIAGAVVESFGSTIEVIQNILDLRSGRRYPTIQDRKVGATIDNRSSVSLQAIQVYNLNSGVRHYALSELDHDGQEYARFKKLGKLLMLSMGDYSSSKPWPMWFGVGSVEELLGLDEEPEWKPIKKTGP